MSRRPLEQRNHRKLQQVGGHSLAITLPREFLAELGWEKGHEVKVSIKKGKKVLIIEEVE
jgi:antitoxin component of MazEF toxin-antitoxin module